MDSKTKELVELQCMGCDAVFMGEPPKMCCSGRDCGCMGLPIDPILCGPECYDKMISRNKEPKFKIKQT